MEMRACSITDRAVAILLLILYFLFAKSMIYYAPPVEIADEEILSKLNKNGQWQYVYLFSILSVVFLWIASKVKDNFVKGVVAIGEQMSILFAWCKWRGESMFELKLEDILLFIGTAFIAFLSVFYMDKIQSAIIAYYKKYLLILNKKRKSC